MIDHAVPDQLARRLAVAALGVGLLAGCTSQSAAPSAPPPVDSTQAAAIDRTVQEAMQARHLRSVIVRVTVDGKLLQTVTSKPLLYPPGTNWNYAHTNYLILGSALEKATGKRMSDLMQEVAVALALTFTEDAFAPDGSYKSEVGSNAADPVWRQIAAVVAPEDPPPTMKP